MRHSRKLRLSTVPVLVATAAIALAATASAGGQLFREPIDENEIRVEEDFCGVDGLTVEFARHRVGIGSRRSARTGRPRLLRLQPEGDRRDHERRQRQLRDGVTPRSATRISGSPTTATARSPSSSSPRATSTLYGPDGKAIARNPGQIRFEFLVDHGGTPSDPSDDEELEFLGDVKGSTGRTDDYCAAALPVLLGS